MRLAPGLLSCVSPLEFRVLGPGSHLWDGFWVTAVWSHQKFRVWGPTFRMQFSLAYILGKKSWKLVVNISRRSSSQTFFKIRVLKYFAWFTGKHSCWSLFLIKLQALDNFIENEAPMQVFFCEYCEIFKSSFLIHLCWLLLHFRVL